MALASRGGARKGRRPRKLWEYGFLPHKAKPNARLLRALLTRYFDNGARRPIGWGVTDSYLHIESVVIRQTYLLRLRKSATAYTTYRTERTQIILHDDR